MSLSAGFALFSDIFPGCSEEVEKLRASLKEMTKERDHLALNCEKYREDLGHEAAFRSDNCM